MEWNSKNIFFRLAEPEDAGFIHALRMNKDYNTHLSEVDPDVNKQIEWLNEYKKREQNGQEYYFIIHRKKDSKAIGTVRLYDFIDAEKSFCWGSWILNESKTKYAALESAILIYNFAFLHLGFKRCHMDIRKANTKVINFHKRFGVKMVDETELDIIGHYYLNDYLAIRDQIIDVYNK